MHMFTTSLIVISAFVTVLETVPAVHSISTRIWFGLETSVVALFTVEYIARSLAWSNTWSTLFHWVFSFYGVIDLLSVLPYYIELILLQDTSVYFRFSILRMFRLLRVFRPFRYNHTILLTIEVMYLSVRRSQLRRRSNTVFFYPRRCMVCSRHHHYCRLWRDHTTFIPWPSHHITHIGFRTFIDHSSKFCPGSRV